MCYSVFIKEFKQDNWDSFVTLCDQYSTVITELISTQKFEQSIPEDVKKVACYKLRTSAASWFMQELPIIDGRRPIDLLEKCEGLTVIKEILLRIPN